MAVKHHGMELFLLVAGDIGETATLLALYDPGERAHAPVLRLDCRGVDNTELSIAVREFLAASHCVMRADRFDVASPVINGPAILTNLPWTIDPAVLREHLASGEVFLLNGLQATGFAAPRPLAEEPHSVNNDKGDAARLITVITPARSGGEPKSRPESAEPPNPV